MRRLNHNQKRSVRLTLTVTILLLSARFLPATPADRVPQPDATSTGRQHQSPATNNSRASKAMEDLQTLGLNPEAVQSVDSHGIPGVCATGSRILPQAGLQPTPSTTLPSDTRSWELIPCVIRDDGRDEFRIQVNANGPVRFISMPVPRNLVSASGSREIIFKDDGQGYDQTANDFIFTSEPLRYNANDPITSPYFYMADTNSPQGLGYIDLDGLTIVETNNTVSSFLIVPQVGILDQHIPAIHTLSGSPNIQVSPHLINVQTSNSVSQSTLRIGSSLPVLTLPIYGALPDDFDFLVCFSTDHLERLPRISGVNFIIGVHNTVKVDFSGTGAERFDNSAIYGSAGRLKAVNILDANARGAFVANATHEIIHQWVAGLPMSVGLNEDGAHYKSRSNIGSLVGGQLWNDEGGGVLTVNCAEGRNGAHHAPTLDKYMMGLIDGSDVHLSGVYSQSLPPPGFMCDQPISNITTVSIAEIQAAVGVRSPGPEGAQRDFSIGFVAETKNRLMSPTETTFYETLAAYFTKSIPSTDPDPYLTQNWVPIGRFFGERTRWTSALPSVVRPNAVVIDKSSDGAVTLSAVGFPGETYTLERSADLISWTPVASAPADPSDGTLTFNDSATAPHNFYRLSYE